MNRNVTAAAAGAVLLGLAGCVEETAAPGMPSEAEQACLQAVSTETNNGDVVLLEARSAEGGTQVIVGVGPQRARWECVARSDGSTSRPMSLTDEGAL